MIVISNAHTAHSNLKLLRALTNQDKQVLMKKIILMTVAFIAVICGAGIFYLNSQIESLLAQHLPEIKKTITKAVGAPVRLDTVSASILPSPSIEIKGFHILDTATKKSALGINKVSLKVSLLPLLSKRISVTTLELHSPRISARKTSTEGVVIKGLPVGNATESNAPSTRQGNPSEQQETTSLPFAIGIENISVSDGSFTFTDEATKQVITVSELEVAASVALEPSEVTLPTLKVSCSINKNIPVKISITDAVLNPATGMVRVPQATLTHSSGDISLTADIKGNSKGGNASLKSTGLQIAKLFESARAINPAVPDLNVAGALGINIKLVLDASGLPTTDGSVTLQNVSAAPDKNTDISSLSGDIKLSGPVTNILVNANALRLNYNKSPIKLNGTFRASPQTFNIEALNVEAFKGTTQLVSNVSLGDQMVIAASPTINNISLEDLFGAVKPSINGLIQGTLKTFQGEFSGIRSNDPAKTISGKASVLIGEGAIKDYNLAQQVLQSVEGLPFLSGTLRSKVPPEFEAIVTNPDTGIREFRSKVSLNQGAANFSELYLESDIFSITSKGTYKPSGEVHLPATIRFNAPFSRAITERVVELKALLDSSDRLELPIVIHGTLPKVVAAPDIPVIIRKATVGGVRQAVTGALKGGKGVGKALGGLMGF